MIVLRLPEMSPIPGGMSRVKGLPHEMTETGGERLVRPVEGTIVIGVVVVVQMTARPHGVEVRRLVMTDRLEVGRAGVEVVAVETTGDGTTGLVVTTLIDATWTGLRETTTVEIVTWTAVLRGTATLTELQETATGTVEIAMQTEDHETGTTIGRRHETVILTEAQETEITIDETLTVHHETATWTVIVAGKGTGTLTGLVPEIVREILIVRVIPTTVLRVIHMTVRLVSRTMTEHVTIVDSGTAIEKEIGVLRIVVHHPAMTGEAEVCLFKLKSKTEHFTSFAVQFLFFCGLYLR